MKYEEECKLNEKLAVWAGFKRLPQGKAGFHWERCVKMMNWMPPVDKSDVFYSMPHLPNFVGSLDACFKWLVPKLIKGGYDVFLSSDNNLWEVEINDREFPPKKRSMLQQGNALTLTLCLAIEKLIDE